MFLCFGYPNIVAIRKQYTYFEGSAVLYSWLAVLSSCTISAHSRDTSSSPS